MTMRSAKRAGAWRKVGLAGLLIGLLSGCAEVGQSVQNAVNDVSAAFQPKEQAPAVPPPTSYCYRTLVKVNCYAQPLPGSEANRLIGYQGPAPRSSSGTGPLSL